MKKIFWFVPFLAIAMAGCNTGDTPVETYKTEPEIEKVEGKDDMTSSINSNPQIPDAAKQAMGTKK